MKVSSFEEIIAWQKAKELTIEVYKDFGVLKDFGFKDQIQRAAVSVMNNIAEGFERGSNPDFKRFLFVAKGSAGEVRSLLVLALELGYISKTRFSVLYELCISTARLTSAFIKKL